jgi:outer membrane lipoprotein-sorting protein
VCARTLTRGPAAPYNEHVSRGLVALSAVVLLPLAALATDARSAVEGFVAKAAGAPVVDLVLDETFVLYHPDGRHSRSSGEQRVWIKVPRRQRIEQVMDGRREVRLVDGDRVWIRTADGKVREAPAERGRDRTHLLVPFRRSADDVLAEWRSLGIRDEVSHVTRQSGREITVIGAKPGDRQSPAVWLDPERGVIRMVVREKLPRGEGLVDLTYSEHQPLSGGLMFPYRQEAFVDGKMIVLIVVRSVAVNSNIPDTLFDPDALRRIQ